MATRASRRDLIRMRLEAHSLIGQRADSPASVASRMLAVQAQDLPAAGWVLGVRAGNITSADIAAAFRDRSIVRSWPMRGTLHIVPTSELGWMLQLTASRMLRKTATRRSQLGLDDATLRRARSTAERTLAVVGSLNRRAFLLMLESAGIDTTGQRGYHIIYHLAQVGVLLWGPCAGDELTAASQSLVLAADWVPADLLLDRDEALSRFLIGYLTGHGPATLHDFAWWSGLTVADARTAQSRAGNVLTELTVDGVSYRATAEGVEAAPNRASAGVHALAGFDEYVLGYRDRALVLDAEHAPLITPGGNGIFQPTILARGRVIGTWRKRKLSRTTSIEPNAFRAMSPADRKAFEWSARRYRRYLGLPRAL